MSIDWADEKAREWLARAGVDAKRRIPAGLAVGATREDSLAALLREVAAWEVERKVALHQARRVVEEVRGPARRGETTFADATCELILSRLEAL